MRIGITCYPTYGGSGVVATELGQELAARGHDIHFISYAPPIRMNPNDPHIHFHEVEVASYPLFDHPPYTLALATKMLEVFEAESLDILHVHYAIPHSVSAMLARSMAAPRRLPFVTTLHGTDITLVGSNRSYLPITRFSIEQSDGVTAISDYLLKQTLKEFDIKRPIEVIPNFVNCDLYTRTPNEAQRAQWAPDGEPILMHLSNFRPVKCVTDVVEIFAMVRAKMPAKLVLIGDGPDRGAAEYLGPQEASAKRCLLPGQTKRRLRKTKLRRSVPAPLATRIVWPGRPGGHGLRSSGNRHQCRRHSGGGPTWSRWLFGGTRRRERSWPLRPGNFVARRPWP